jgi:hypothetical protein
VSGFHFPTLYGDLSVRIDDLFPVVIKTRVGLCEIESLPMNVALQPVFSGQFLSENSGLGISVFARERGAHDQPRAGVLRQFKVVARCGVGFGRLRPEREPLSLGLIGSKREYEETREGGEKPRPECRRAIHV